MAENRNRKNDRSIPPGAGSDPMAEQQERDDHPERASSESLTSPRDEIVNPHLDSGLAWGQPTDVVHGGQPVPDSEARDRQNKTAGKKKASGKKDAA